MMKKVSVVVCSLAALMMLGGVALASDYVGSNKCFSCHQDQFNDWQASGHPYKIRVAEKARYTGIPLPPGYAWEDIAYVIGGANKKARFIDREGYIVTTAKDGSEAKTQYNTQDGTNTSLALYEDLVTDNGTVRTLVPMIDWTADYDLTSDNQKMRLETTEGIDVHVFQTRRVCC